MMKMLAKSAAHHASEEGFALVMVLWGLVLLSLIAVAVVAETRNAGTLAASRAGESRAALLAEAAIERALLSIDGASGGAAWPEDGTPRMWAFGDGKAAIAIQDECGKIDAFNAPDLMLSAALSYAGLDAARAQTVMRQLRDARQKAQFTGALAQVASLDDLRGITSLNGAEIDRLRSVMTLRCGFGGFDPVVATPQVLRLLPGVDDASIQDYLSERTRVTARADAEDVPASPAHAFTMISPRGAFTVRAEACTADGHLAIREAMIRRDSPGHYSRLELREPITAQFLTGCHAAVKTASIN
jgi:general secretion pathway protein K